jgi:AcrR family transcriptional regulator
MLDREHPRCVAFFAYVKFPLRKRHGEKFKHPLIMNIHYIFGSRLTRGCAMPRLTKKETRIKLRDALVAEVVENGISALNVAGIVTRAKVSAGTVYVHFENKDDMLRQVYMELKADFHSAITENQGATDSAQLVRDMWFAMFDFVRTRPQDFLFLDYASAAKILSPEQQEITDKYAAEIAALLKRGVDDATLADLDTSLLSLLLVAPAMQLARSAVLSGQAIPETLIEQTFERVWLSIAK